MKKHLIGWSLILWLVAAAGYAELSPLALTFFGIYGQPVDPPALTGLSSDGFGFNALAEWNASTFTSLGLGFEQIAFRGASTVPMLNFEGRLFPMENEKGRFSPYVSGGAGLNLSSGAWEGPVQLKAAIGSRVVIGYPVYLDLAVESHWLQPPDGFQYVDFRYGLSLSFDLKGQNQPAESKPAEKPAALPKPAVKAISTPLSTATVNAAPTETPVPTETPSAPSTLEMPAEPQTITIEAAPVTTLEGVKKYYQLGMNAFLDHNYALSLKLLLKSLEAKEIHGSSYYYAENYATIGVMYQFHAHKVKDHLQKALYYYRKALDIDPRTKSAREYYYKLKAKMEKGSKKKARPRRRVVHHKAISHKTEEKASATPANP